MDFLSYGSLGISSINNMDFLDQKKLTKDYISKFINRSHRRGGIEERALANLRQKLLARS